MAGKIVGYPKEYGFCHTLPEDWKGTKFLEEQWDRQGNEIQLRVKKG
jgi:hypothetical protein